MGGGKGGHGRGERDPEPFLGLERLSTLEVACYEEKNVDVGLTVSDLSPGST